MSINPSTGKLEAMLFSAIIPGSGQYLINNQKGKLGLINNKKYQ